MEEFRLCNSDYRFLTIVWDHAPVGSGELVRLCQEQLGWKKSTTYTEIRRLCEKGVLGGSGTGVGCICGAYLRRIAAGFSGGISWKQEAVGKGSRRT